MKLSPKTIAALNRRGSHGLKVKRDMSKSKLLALEFAALFQSRYECVTETEVYFHPERKWRFDIALPGWKIAIEIQGGIFVRGGHSRGAQQMKDFEKMNHAQALGWRVLQFTPEQLLRNETFEFVRGMCK